LLVDRGVNGLIKKSLVEEEEEEEEVKVGLVDKALTKIR